MPTLASLIGALLAWLHTALHLCRQVYLPPAPDPFGLPPLVQAGFWGWVVSAIGYLVDALGAAGGAIATSLEAVVAYLASAMSWLVGRVGNLIVSSGAMFSKAWEALRTVWSDVLRPALQKLYGWIQDLRDWLKVKLQPVFDLLSTLRKHIREIYKTFIRPILDAIDVARGILKILQDLHIPFAKALDDYLTKAEQVITENFLQLQGWVIDIQNVLTRVVTLDYLFNRVALLGSLRRDAPLWLNMWWNAQLQPGAGSGAARPTADDQPMTAAELTKAIGDYLNDGTGPLADDVDHLVALFGEGLP